MGALEDQTLKVPAFLKEARMYPSKRASHFLSIPVFVLLIGLIATWSFGCAAKKEVVPSPWKGKYPALVIAHRGFSSQAPENTLVAFRKAVELGCDMIELDIQFSKDKEVVVIHDDTLERTTNGKERLIDFTLADIKKLDAGSWVGPQFSGEKVPTLKEVLQQSKGKIPVNIEIKHPKDGQYNIEELAEKAVKEVKDAGMLSQVNFFSFNPYSLQKVRRIEPKAWVTFI